MNLRYPIGEQDFESIRKNGKVYVDKTSLIYDLQKNSKYNFLSRPRRFGKSLLLSTMKAFFEGKKDLFEGLEIFTLEKNWQSYPVLHLSFAVFDSFDPKSLESILINQFLKWEKRYEVQNNNFSLGQRFGNIIESVYRKTNKPVVILIDEYDHALINTLEREEIHKKNKELLKSIYSNLKEFDACIQFAFLTGVTRFSKAGIFSGLNNLNDISFDPHFTSICGFTENEIRGYLWTGIQNLGEAMNLKPEEALTILKDQYDGYHFSEKLIDLYNPFSLLNSLVKLRIDNYWIESATPSFLINRLKETDEPFSELFNEEADTTDLAAVDTAFSSPVALLYQTGYLTIKEYNRKENLYKLGIPNKEVREGFLSVLLADISERNRRKSIRATQRMKDSLLEGNIQEFLESIQAFFAGISYELMPKAPEIYFENNLYVVLTLMGLDVKAEEETSYGRIDISIKTNKFIYILEIKKDKSPEEALQQILKKEYGLKYKFDGRKIILAGINFSSEKRNIDGWITRFYN